MAWCWGWIVGPWRQDSPHASARQASQGQSHLSMGSGLSLRCPRLSRLATQALATGLCPAVARSQATQPELAPGPGSYIQCNRLALPGCGYGRFRRCARQVCPAHANEPSQRDAELRLSEVATSWDRGRPGQVYAASDWLDDITTPPSQASQGRPNPPILLVRVWQDSGRVFPSGRQRPQEKTKPTPTQTTTVVGWAEYPIEKEQCTAKPE